jgi:RNA polymerase sigma-70 factor (sigma-E family)
VLLSSVEPVTSGPRDEIPTVPDIISAGGAGDFRDFAESRWPELVRLGFGLTGDRGLAEDLAQTALARAYLAWRRVSQADDPDAYVRRILVNASHRRFRRRRVTEQPGQLPDTLVEGPADLVSERADLVAALQRLPARQRTAVVLRYWADLTDTQIAAATGSAPGTVRSQLSRAVTSLRAALDPAAGRPADGGNGEEPGGEDR